MNQKHTEKGLIAAFFLVILSSCQGQMIPYGAQREGEPVLLQSKEACRRFLAETVSASDRGQRQEITIRAKKEDMDTLVIAELFPDVVNISKTEIGEQRKNGETLIDCRIGFEWRERAPDEKNEVRPNPDSAEEKDRMSWSVGDVVERQMAGKNRRFRCIDDDYGDKSGQYEKTALFLAETIIPSDTDSTYEQKTFIPFGTDNNYKKSGIRAWLSQYEANFSDAVWVSTGSATAFSGKSAMGDFSRMTMKGLTVYRLPYQDCRDRLFLLSLEEAYRYRKEIGKFSGSGPYGRGFWLRTPGYRMDSQEKFFHENMEYAVDLEQGCFRQAEVTDTAFGICPAFCLPQA